jgi:hypothetical protein
MEFMPPGEADRFKKSSAACAPAPFSLLENVNMRKDGSFVVLARAHPVLQGRRVSGYMGVHRMSPRGKAEDDLKEQREVERPAHRGMGCWD